MNDSTRPTLRDGIIHNALEQRRADDTKILQKVNAVNREAFLIKFPGMLEHSLRLVNERLMQCLIKPDDIQLGKPSTWPAQPDEILALTQSLRNLHEVYQHWIQ